MQSRPIAAAVIVLLFGMSSARADESTAREPTPQTDDSTLLRAINFALTGSDSITYVFADRAKCIVSRTHDSSKSPVQAIETFYLDNVDASRITFFRLQPTSARNAEAFLRVELHGETVIRENTFAPTALPATTVTDATLDLHTSEYARVTRAWKYIYAHGCQSAKSSF